MKRAAVELRIEELVLHGVAPADRERIAEGLQRELGALLARPTPWPAGSRALGALDAGQVRADSPARLAGELARAVYGSLAASGGGKAES